MYSPTEPAGWPSSTGIVRTVKARPTIRKLRSSGLIPSAWPGIPRRSSASLSVLVEWREKRARFWSVIWSSRDSEPGGCGPDPVQPAGMVLFGLAASDRRKLVQRDRGQDLLLLAADLDQVDRLSGLVVGRVHLEVAGREVAALLDLERRERLDQLLAVGP